jgi:hypothetical protein
LRRIDDNGQLAGRPSAITSHALPSGGIALASAGRAQDGVALAWIAREGASSRVRLARLDPRGRRTAETDLPANRGSASDVALAWAGDGWMVSWVDGRNGDGAVYATKVDRELSRVGRAERVTGAPSDAGDIALAINGELAWLAWSDSRESRGEGLGDIYAATLRVRDARPVGPEEKVLATAGHSRSPKLAAVPGGMLLAWIEDAPTGLEGPGAAMVARLDGRAQLVGEPARLPLAAGGRPTTIALEPSGLPSASVRAILSRTQGDGVTLDALLLSPAGAAVGGPWPLLELDAPGSFDVALSLAEGSLYFDDLIASADRHRLRRAAIAWAESR